MRILVEVSGNAVKISDEVTLEVAQQKVGGYVQVVRGHWHGAPCQILMDEEGKLKGKKLNMAATFAYGNNNDHIVGDVVILTGKDEWK